MEEQTEAMRIIEALRGKVTETTVIKIEEQEDKVVITAVCPTLELKHIPDQFAEALNTLGIEGKLTKSIELRTVSTLFP